MAVIARKAGKAIPVDAGTYEATLTFVRERSGDRGPYLSLGFSITTPSGEKAMVFGNAPFQITPRGRLTRWLSAMNPQFNYDQLPDDAQVDVEAFKGSQCLVVVSNNDVFDEQGNYITTYSNVIDVVPKPKTPQPTPTIPTSKPTVVVKRTAPTPAEAVHSETVPGPAPATKTTTTKDPFAGIEGDLPAFLKSNK